MTNRVASIVMLTVLYVFGWVSSANAQSLSATSQSALPFISPSVLKALEGQNKRLAATNEVGVIVTFKAAKNRNGLPSVAGINSARASMLATLPAASYKVISSYSHIPAVSMNINSAALNALRSNPNVAAINEDLEVSMNMTQANALTGVAGPHALGFTGEGGRVAIIDTGVDSAGGLVHASLADDLLGQACFRTENDCIGGATSAEDQHGHGTHVAGIITGPNGVAPDAQFYALKVFTTGSTSDTNILNALNYVVALNAATPGSVNLINMSLGGGNYPDEASCNVDSAAYVSAFSTLNTQGVSIFVATGNDGQIASVGRPGCVSGAIGVGSVGDAVFAKNFSTCVDNGAPDKVSCFSNATPVQGAGELLDLLAPGCDITSTGLDGSTSYTICGTSMATPYAAGVAAVLIDYLNTNTLSMTPAQIEAHMEATGVPVSDYRMPAGAPTFPRVNPPDMIAALAVDPPTGFAITGTTSTSVAMRWDDSAVGNTYRVYVSVNGGDASLVDTVTPAGASTSTISLVFTDTNAPCGVLTYFVRAFDGTFESVPSNTDSTTARTCPVAPDALALAIVDANTVDLTWTDHNVDETANILQRRVNSGSFTDYQTLGAGTNLEYTDAGLTCGTAYEYRAVAVRNGDRSAPSSVVRHVGCAPSNDPFVGAKAIGATPYADSIANAHYASVADDDPVHSCRIQGAGTGSHTLWWSYTPSVNGKLNLDTIGSSGSMSDTLLSVYTGTLGGFTSVACSDDISNADLKSRITNLAVTAGTTYHLLVSRWTTAPTATVGAVVLNASFAANPGVTVTPTTMNVTEGGATDGYAVALLSAPAADVTIDVTGDADCTASPSQLTFTAANFSVAQAVTVTAVDDGDVEGAHSCAITHSATSTDAGYNGVSIANVAGNVTDNDVATFALTLDKSGNGSGVVSGDGNYNDGATATVTATADTGSTFAGWSGANGAECTTGSVVMDANKSCTATFTLNRYVLTLTSTGSGSGTVGGGGEYNYGDAATVTATPNAGSTFAGWSGANGAECTTGSVAMDTNKSCVATFNRTVLVTYNTGFKKPTANQADAGGDGNGYEIAPANAYTADGAVAIDMNSGTNTSTSCANAGKDRHRFFNYSFNIPNAAVIKGIQVRLKAKADSSVGAPMICVQLSGDGGLTWTAAATTPTLGSTFAEFTLGSTASTWGRAWNKNSLSNANFRVRVINVSSSTERDFRLDRLAVKVAYQ